MDTAIHPELLKYDQIDQGYDDGDILDEEVQKKLFEGGIHKLADNGILGNPHGTDKKLGELCLDAYAKVLVQYFNSRISEI